MSYLLEMKNIIKAFGTVKAVDNISLTLESGQILSLCGENGSGKSTLMKVLSAVYPYGSYSGEIYFGGERLKANHIRDTEDKGIAIIHQELALVQEMTVLENIFLGREYKQYGVMDYNQMYLQCLVLLKQVQLDIDPNVKLRTLGLGQQQLVEIAKALNKKVRLLILDEPTASLTEKETEVLLKIIDNLRNHNIACIYISHKLNEVKAISDMICVIRDGRHIDTVPAKTVTEDQIIAMMVGRELTELYPTEEYPIGDEVLRVENLSAWQPLNSHIKQVDDVSFSLHRGEILGLAGLVGAGRTETMRCIFGVYDGKNQGNIYIDNQLVDINSCAKAIQLGIVMVPEDRKKDGIIPVMSVEQNISLAALGNYTNWLSIINEVDEQQATYNSIQSLTIRTPSPAIAIASLSGGNQQKAILAKCLLLKPKILILDEPTRGIDVGAKYEIYKLINKLSKEKIAIIVISSELPEVLGLSDRVLVMHEGKLKANLVNQGLTQEKIMEAALRSQNNE